MIAVAGLQVPRVGMIEVAHRLVLAGELEAATAVLGGLVEGGKITLTIAEREAVLRALDDPPAGLEPLRAVLLAEHVGRVRDGLA